MPYEYAVWTICKSNPIITHIENIFITRFLYTFYWGGSSNTYKTSYRLLNSLATSFTYADLMTIYFLMLRAIYFQQKPAVQSYSKMSFSNYDSYFTTIMFCTFKASFYATFRNKTKTQSCEWTTETNISQGYWVNEKAATNTYYSHEMKFQSKLWPDWVYIWLQLVSRHNEK